MFTLLSIPFLQCSIEDSINMELKSDPENMKDNQPIKNGADFDILGKDEAFWQRAVKTLAQEQISENIDDISENVSK